MSDPYLKDLHCLIVDDDPVFLQVCESMLKSIGVGKVSSGQSGSAALSILASSSRPVDIILCDLDMKAGNGLQLLKAIRTGQVRSTRLDLPFVIVSGKASAHLIQTAATLDVSGYLVKPLMREKLKAAILKARQTHFAIDPARYVQVAVPASVI